MSWTLLLYDKVVACVVEIKNLGALKRTWAVGRMEHYAQVARQVVENAGVTAVLAVERCGVLNPWAGDFAGCRFCHANAVVARLVE